ncbi:Pentatricopeptide repeat-containing protein [Dendrobium catenatum]|uniref:Pentatricopeptide repeat-containing protein n=1 Tax=Dendrobium catenatum TaxID=906689 RepID=A0A2I0VN43_9ASPA|nr:Pentatricopeptide repeat-containing protein [Dendrobium catenatum]
MDCERRSAVDDNRIHKIRLAVDNDRRQGRRAVDNARSWIAFYQAQAKESLDCVDRNLDWIEENLRAIRKIRMSSATIPRYSSSSSLPSSAPCKCHQSCHNYPPLELPLRWHDSPPKYPPLECLMRWRDPPPPQTTSPKSNPIAPLLLQHANNEPTPGDERGSAPDDELDSVPGDKHDSASGIQSSSVARDFASDSSSLPITNKATADPASAGLIGTRTELPSSVPLDSEMQDPTLTTAMPIPSDYITMPSCDVISWTAMLMAYADNGEISKARVPKRNAASWNAMISAYARDPKLLKESYELFSAMPNKNSVTYAAMITGFSRGGMLLQAEEV